MCGELVDGVIYDFNLMWCCDVVNVELLYCLLVGSMFFFIEVDIVWVIYLLFG